MTGSLKCAQTISQLPRESCYQEIITDERGQGGLQQGSYIAPKKLVIISWKYDLKKGWLLCCLIEFTENACLQNEISPLLTMQHGRLDRMGRGPFLPIRGTCEPTGVGDGRQSGSTATGKSSCPLPHCQAVIKEGLGKPLEFGRKKA